MAAQPAPAVANWSRSRWKRGSLGVSPPAPFGGASAVPDGGTGDLIGLKVELFINSAWTDVTPYVYYRDRISILRGRSDETSQIQPQTASLTLDNRDGRFSPRNPIGPWYGQLGRNTPIRISRLNNGIRRYRFYGEIPAWPLTSDISGSDVTIRVQAAGQMRRLFQGNQPLHSPLYRAFGLGLGVRPDEKPYAYWPCEDGKYATSIASGLTGGLPMALSGQALPTFESDSSFPGSLALPLLSGSIWTAAIPTYINSSTDPSVVGATAALGFLMSVPATGAYDGGVLMRMFTTGSIARLDLVYGSTGGGSLALVGYDSFGTQLFTSGYRSPQAFTAYGFPGYNGMPVFINMLVTPSGTPGTIIWEGNFEPLYPRAGLVQSFGIFAGSMSGTVGVATGIVVNPDGHFDDTAIGHIVFQGFPNFVLGGLPANAWLTEPPTTPFTISGFAWSSGRFLRLCQEQNVQAAVISAAGVNAGDPTTMGYQANDTFANLIQEPATTSGGLLFEARDQGALVLRERGSLYNQAAVLTLDMSQHQLSAPLIPVDDDALTRNDVTVQRVGGSSNQQVQASGTLSIQPPPAGVGDYPTTYSLSLGSDTLVADQAGWLLHLGTVDEPRYPQVAVNLRHPTFTGSVDMLNAALAVDIGDRIVITNPPAPDFPPDPISQIVQGYSETLGVYEHDVIFNCSPEDPYRVGILEDTVLGHLDTDGSTLATAVSSTATSLSVATTGAAAGSPLWTTSAGDFPFDINVGGERMTVTNITGAASPQTFTVTRSVNGAVKTQTANTDVRLWQPLYLSL